MLKRKIYNRLIEWKKSHSHKCLMVRGARQVGKTYVIRQLGMNEYQSFVEINFIENPEMKGIFADDLSADTIYKRMTAFIQNIKLIPGETLIFLDEIQNCGNARTALKFLAKDGRFDVITAGRLLGLPYGKNGDADVEEPATVPAGYEDYLTMHPLDFEEFLWAEGHEADAISQLKECFDKRKKVPLRINEKHHQLFREYIVVGGMPEVVDEYVHSHDFNKVAKLQEMLLDNYRMDISKHAKGAEKRKVRLCFDAIPRQLAKELKKFQYSTVERGQTSKKYGASTQWLKDAALVNACYNIYEPIAPLMANAKPEQFKLYINDTGLLCAMYGPETKLAILNNTIKGNAKEGIYENIISQSLVRAGHALYYFKPDDSHELEFLMEIEGEVIPVEVKAGNTATVSLNSFTSVFNPPYAYKFASGNVGQSGSTITLPHYMVMFL